MPMVGAETRASGASAFDRPSNSRAMYRSLCASLPVTVRRLSWDPALQTITQTSCSVASSAIAATQERLLSHSLEHVDKSGARSPEAVARRRAFLWRVHVLTGRSATKTAAHWHNLTGERVTRQAVAKQIEIVGLALADAAA